MTLSQIIARGYDVFVGRHGGELIGFVAHVIPKQETTREVGEYIKSNNSWAKAGHGYTVEAALDEAYAITAGLRTHTMYDPCDFEKTDDRYHGANI